VEHGLKNSVLQRRFERFVGKAEHYFYQEKKQKQKEFLHTPSKALMVLVLKQLA